jgi:hypothetical protein
MVFSNMLQLAGKTEILLTPNETSPVGPLINAGEIYQIVPVGGRTATKDGVYVCPFDSDCSYANSFRLKMVFSL